MTSAEIGLLSTLVLTIIGVIAAISALYAKIKSAVKNIVIVDENGKKRVNTVAIFRVLVSAVSEAERSGLAGAEKKVIAVNAAQKALEEMGIEFNVTEISDSIETIVNIINVFIKKK